MAVDRNRARARRLTSGRCAKFHVTRAEYAVKRVNADTIGRPTARRGDIELTDRSGTNAVTGTSSVTRVPPRGSSPTVDRPPTLSMPSPMMLFTPKPTGDPPRPQPSSSTRTLHQSCCDSWTTRPFTVTVVARACRCALISDSRTALARAPYVASSISPPATSRLKSPTRCTCTSVASRSTMAPARSTRRSPVHDGPAIDPSDSNVSTSADSSARSRTRSWVSASLPKPPRSIAVKVLRTVS